MVGPQVFLTKADDILPCNCMLNLPARNAARLQHNLQLIKMPCRFTGYEMHELVQLTAGDVVGVIVDIGKDTCRVLTNQVGPSPPPPSHLRMCVPPYHLEDPTSLPFTFTSLK